MAASAAPRCANDRRAPANGPRAVVVGGCSQDAGRLVGAGREPADGADCAHLCDIGVLPSHQGRGLGRAIAGRLVAQPRGHRRIIHYAVPGREAFYAKPGFRRMKTAMANFENPRQRARLGCLDEA
ncbi:MAG: GNAT family N-acetyltransferase [Burkholderiaceae bacterium]|nr:GNAT family N-acetyltransferase [Burkholderiaceae bacterium]